MDTDTRAAASMEHAEHMAHGVSSLQRSKDYTPLNAAVRTVSALKFAFPVLVSPPTQRNGNWTAKSDAQNRTLRTNLTLDPRTGRVVARQDFSQQPWLDQAVGIGVAAHEGQLFGVLNQVIGLCTAMGLLTLSISAVAMWWKRRPAGALGSPVSKRTESLSWGIFVGIGVLCVYLPLLAASMLFVYLLECFVLRRFSAISIWLGLEFPAARKLGNDYQPENIFPRRSDA